MRIKKRHAIQLLFSGLPMFTALIGTGQELISPASGGGAVSNLYIDGSVGEPVVQTGTVGETTLTQGFQQPEIMVVGIAREGEPAGKMGVYPNPVRRELHIRPDVFGNDLTVTAQITDMNGKQIIDAEFDAVGTSLQLADLASAQYFLRIQSRDNSYTETFKIIKTN